MKRYETRYRVIENKDSTDFNNYLPLTVVAYDYDPQNKLIRRKGFNGWHSTEKIHDLFHDRTGAEVWLVTRISGEWVGTLKHENNKLKTENQQLKSDQIKLAVEKLEELQHYQHPTNTLCLPSCWVIDKVNEMIKELKGESDE